jgi:hypothetical protein
MVLSPHCQFLGPRHHLGRQGFLGAFAFGSTFLGAHTFTCHFGWLMYIKGNYFILLFYMSQIIKHDDERVTKLNLKFKNTLISKANKAKAVVKLRKYVNNLRSNKFLKLYPELYIVSRTDFKCPDPFCNTYGKGNHRRECYYDEGTSRYNYGITEFNMEIFNRSIPLNEFASMKLQEELPSQQWLDSQKHYVETMSENDKNYLKLYSINGDRVLNSFVRNGFKMTEDDIDYIEANMSEFQQTFDNFVEKNGNSYEKYMMDYYYAMDNIIRSSSPLDKRIVLYRGIKDNSYFNGLENNLYKNKGILSCTGDTKMAIDFSGYAFINRIVIPKGYNCLLNSLSQVIDEFEFILPDNTQFYVSKPFQSKTYLYKIWPEEIQTNEVILVGDKKHIFSGGSIQYGGMWQQGGFFMTCS